MNTQDAFNNLTDHVRPPRRKPGRPPGTPGIVTRPVAYVCSLCERECAKSDLLTKRANYAEMGRGGKQVRSRTVAWICRDCLDAGRDPDWEREAWRDAPGMGTLDDENKAKSSQ